MISAYKSLIISIIIVLLGSQIRVSASNTKENPMWVAFLSPSAMTDLGWTWQHNLARTELERHYDGLVRTEFFENVPEEYESSYRKLKAIADSGKYKMIVGCSFGYQFPMFDLANSYPDLKWLHVSGYLFGPPNFSTMFGRIFQSRYLTGVVAGLMTRTNRLAFLSSFPIPEVFRGTNAFFLGARSVNFAVEMSLFWTNSWFDPDLEQYASQKLLQDYSIDVIGHFSDSHIPQLVAKEMDRFSIGYHSDMTTFVGSEVLTSAVWNWTWAYQFFTDQALLDSWVATQYWEPIGTGPARLGTLSPFVPFSVKQHVAQVYESFLNKSFDVFCGANAAPWQNLDVNFTLQGCLSDVYLLQHMNVLHPDIEDLGIIVIPTTRIDVPSSMRIAMQVLAGIVILLCLVIMIITLIFREKLVIKLANLWFLQMTLIGAITMSMAVYTLSLTPPNRASCTSTIWLISCGFSLFCGGLLLKIWYVSTIKTRVKHQNAIKVSQGHLWLIQGALLTVYMALNIVLTVVDAPTDRISHQNLDSPYEYKVVCIYSLASEAIIWTLLGFSICLLVIGCFFTFKNRSIPTRFNESRHVALCIYDFTFVLAVLVPVIAILSDYTAQYLIICLGLIFGTSLSVAFIFAPKLWLISQGRDWNLTSPSDHRSSTNYTNTDL